MSLQSLPNAALTPPIPAVPGAAPGTDKAGRARPMLKSYNPATGEVLGEVPLHDEEDARQAIARAKVAQKKWGALPLEERIAVLRRFQAALVKHSDEVAQLVARETGKVLQEAFQCEVLPVLDLTNYFCSEAPRILEKRSISMKLLKHRRSYIHYRPRGIVLVISPWNFPFNIASGEVVMALIAGNAVIHKPASLTPLIALKTRELMDEAGLDPDLYIVLPCPGKVGGAMIDMGVNYVNFTGSTAVGKEVAARCGRNLIPCSMELGGKDPAIVRADADLDFTIKSVAWGAFCNSGQVCASVERVYVHESIYDSFVERLVKKVESLKQGDPLADETQVGAMRDPGQIEIVHAQVEDARKRGGKVLTGGRMPSGPGQFYPPTVVTDVDDSFEIVREESFGPVLPVMKVKDDEEAIRRSNDSSYGLNAYVYGRDVETAAAVAERLEAGTVMINETLLTQAIPNTPWGGVKESGLGRVHGDDGLLDLCEAYHVNLPSLPVPPGADTLLYYPYSHDMYRRMISATTALFGTGIGARLAGLWGALFPPKNH